MFIEGGSVFRQSDYKTYGPGREIGGEMRIIRNYTRINCNWDCLKLRHVVTLQHLRFILKSGKSFHYFKNVNVNNDTYLYKENCHVQPLVHEKPNY